MDKNKIVDQLNSYVQEINGKFTVRESCKDLDLSVEDELFASFVNFEIPKFCIVGGSDQDELIARTGIIQKFYTKACELLEKLKKEKKYTVQIIKNDSQSFFNSSCDDGTVVFSGKFTSSSWKNEFTPKEIEELKQRQDVAIDWGKAIIKEVEE